MEKELEETWKVENKSRKPKASPKKYKNKKFINNKVIETRKKYKYGKVKIKKLLEIENIKICTSAIETILKEHNLHNKRKKKIKKHKGKHAIYIKEAGEKIQIDVKYAFFGEILYYQFTAVDLATRMSFRYLYDEKTPYNTINFMKRLINYFPFRIHCIQTDNGTEFTHRKHSFDAQHPLDIFL